MARKAHQLACWLALLPFQLLAGYEVDPPAPQDCPGWKDWDDSPARWEERCEQYYQNCSWGKPITNDGTDHSSWQNRCEQWQTICGDYASPSSTVQPQVISEVLLVLTVLTIYLA